MLRRGRVCLVAAGCFIAEPAVRGVWGELPTAWTEGWEMGIWIGRLILRRKDR